MTRPTKFLMLWLVAIFVCGAVLAFKLKFSFDLGVFLPAPQTVAQKTLVERLGQGPGARFLIVALANVNDERLEAIAAELTKTDLFDQVLTAASSPDLEDIPYVVMRYRYLLADNTWSEDSLRSALDARKADLAVFGGEAFNQHLGADPTFLAIEVLEKLAVSGSEANAWVTTDGKKLLLLETKAPAFDIQGQTQAVIATREILAGLESEISGPGVFGVELRQTIQDEARKRTIMASAGLALVLLVAYRRWKVLFLAGLPLATGMLAGLTAVSLLFPQVHGLTLAFGFTLLGIAIDYPLHMFSHARTHDGESAMKNIWPTLRLGAISTLIAYLAIAVSGSRGLAQLGTFTAAGLVAAVLTTRFVLAPVTKKSRQNPASDTSQASPVLGFTPLAVMVVIGLFLIIFSSQELTHKPFWDNQLSTLSPVPQQRLERDHELRMSLPTPDLRYVIAIRSSSLQQILEQTEDLDQSLQSAVQKELLQDWQAISRIFPSEKRQAERQRNLPQPEGLKVMFESMIADTAFAPEIFQPFLAHVETSRDLPLLTLEALQDSPLNAFVNNHLYQTNNEWVSLISLYGLKDAIGFEHWLRQESANANLIDLKQASESLIAQYREHVFKVLAIALALILALLLWRITAKRALWSVGNVVAVMVVTAILIHTFSGSLNLYHMTALLLVAGLGLDYALFFSRHESSGQSYADTRHGVTACAASTLIAFAILGFSAIPALQSIGTTVAVGTLLSFGVAVFGSRESVKIL